jgi:hypothetical protein
MSSASNGENPPTRTALASVPVEAALRRTRRMTYQPMQDAPRDWKMTVSSGL